MVARVRGQDRAFRGVRGVGGGSPESVPRVGSRWDEFSTVLDAREERRGEGKGRGARGGTSDAERSERRGGTAGRGARKERSGSGGGSGWLTVRVFVGASG